MASSERAMHPGAGTRSLTGESVDLQREREVLCWEGVGFGVGEFSQSDGVVNRSWDV